MSDLAEALVAMSEGLRLTAYQDTRGLWTIGYGHLLEPQTMDWSGCVTTQAQADMWLEEDMQSARVIAAEFPHYADMNDVQQAALISMAFQLGTKPLQWPDFMAALTAKNYNEASAAGLDSDWARTQTPARAQREMHMLASGLWQNVTLQET